MYKFTSLKDDEEKIKQLFEEVKDKVDKKELYDILDNQMWKAWKDKTVGNNIVFLYEELRNAV